MQKAMFIVDSKYKYHIFLILHYSFYVDCMIFSIFKIWAYSDGVRYLFSHVMFQCEHRLVMWCCDPLDTSVSKKLTSNEPSYPKWAEKWTKEGKYDLAKRPYANNGDTAFSWHNTSIGVPRSPDRSLRFRFCKKLSKALHLIKWTERTRSWFSKFLISCDLVSL